MDFTSTCPWRLDIEPNTHSFLFRILQAAAVEGARLATLAASRANATSQLAMALPPPGALGAPVLPQGVYREEEAFASVHDLVHYAIIASPAQRYARSKSFSPPSRHASSFSRLGSLRDANCRFLHYFQDLEIATLTRAPSTPRIMQSVPPPGIPRVRNARAHRAQTYVHVSDALRMRAHRTSSPRPRLRNASLFTFTGIALRTEFRD